MTDTKRVKLTHISETEVPGLTLKPVLPGVDVTQADLDSLMGLLQSQVGGNPTPVYSEKNGDWAVISTCDCPDCKKFREAMTPLSSATLVRAARYYLVSRIGFLKSSEPATAETKLH